MKHNIREINRKTREIIRRHIFKRHGKEFRQKFFTHHHDDWNILCVAWDTIDDTGLAILNFREKGLSNTDGEKYLRLYGLLQAIFLQQDAIEHLYKAVKRAFDKSNNLPEWRTHPMKSWKELRNYRNLSVGHPMENTSSVKGKTKRVMISRITISDNGFELVISDSDSLEMEYKYIELDISSYEREANSILEDVENFLNSHLF